ncbi:type III toxin-antitoxin system ToxN/AbiQ family toxin [Clostridium sp. AM27-31LB]|uniref:type III toxin-antitoxin system ToxN/AbiQ family toxin n=1 Tax=Clostridia TaxID=186801 RepID=UPI000E478972|nr:type III toxin-antitoxin system ToxN/AbiQ family toxin [Clostridium sp. AM27-31LB]RHT90547.1 type III toxin-antitoxin system ToxN/AbiQ family toxin [Clostridium sp. AM27-31LB]
MKFSKVQFVYIDIDYLKAMNEADSEIFYDENNKEYKFKPHLGMLINQEDREYVIPLTSAKEKHKKWADVSGEWYRIYEIIDITTTPVRKNDIIVDIKNQDLLKNIPLETRKNYKQRILSVLDIRKMFPVKKGVYTKIKFEISSRASIADNQRMALMLKEYNFICNIKEKIEEKAEKIYVKQQKKNKILKYHCNYKKLEQASDEY